MCVYMSVCVCVCVYVSTLRTLITSGVVWCDIGLVKPILQLFSLLPLINWMGIALVTHQCIMHICDQICQKGLILAQFQVSLFTAIRRIQ